MDSQRHQELGRQLFGAFHNKQTIVPLTERYEDISIEDAYKIQEIFMAERIKASGETVIGKKIGVTSRPVQEFLGVYQPDFGILTSGMMFENGATIDLSDLIQPKAEAELAFVLKADLKGPGITAIDVIRATDYVAPCFEIVDSRIDNWKIKIQDTVADNASCGVFVLGTDRAELSEVDVTTSGMVLEKNGALLSTSTGVAVQGSPINAVVWLANTLGELGIPFLKGEVILSGSQSNLVPIVGGDELKCTIGGLGSCSIKFSGVSVVDHE